MYKLQSLNEYNKVNEIFGINKLLKGIFVNPLVKKKIKNLIDEFLDIKLEIIKTQMDEDPDDLEDVLDDSSKKVKKNYSLKVQALQDKQDLIQKKMDQLTNGDTRLEKYLELQKIEAKIKANDRVIRMADSKTKKLLKNNNNDISNDAKSLSKELSESIINFKNPQDDNENIIRFIKDNDISESVPSFNNLYIDNNRWVTMRNDNNFNEIRDTLYVLVGSSYSTLDGHPNIRNADEFINNHEIIWKAVDKNIDEDRDTVIFYKENKNGYRLIGIGHDGMRSNRTELVKKLIKVLKLPGYWIEACDGLEELLYKNGAPYLKMKSTVQEIYKDIKWSNDDGKFVKKGSDKAITIFGRPV